ncbi:tetratricopeptide repeat protein [Hymenobacter sp. HMF4947]|uniref:Tetratricopeptide repeat protein n=1 Tax=Hymenobacter ginkgonis TaxID=2682976 RepID=A0A7K1T9V4_9BACT|nr:tetratricopeptide repeat protein [Hymenobacter ginkgonis]MVN75170.1 tetratricopeptide repeat protein [Hymenobacter ginkgonis]
MKSWFLLLLLLGTSLPGWRWLTRVQEHNTAQAQGQAAATWGRAAEAVYYYQQAVALAGRAGPSPGLLLDLAQAQTQAGQAEAARGTYAQLLGPAVPTGIGSTARQQLALLLAQQRQFAQAISLLRQALKLNPANAAARYNYEILSQYLATQRPANPPLASSSPTPTSPSKPKPTPRDTAAGKSGQAKRPTEQPGTARPGEVPDPSQPAPSTGSPPAPGRPDAAGQADRQRPTPSAGSNAAGGFRPGQGETRPLPTGTAPGRQHGLDGAGSAAASTPSLAGRSPRPGTEAATDADQQLHTQRERLKAMNLTPAQAQQLLDALRESEQQYLQQRPRQRQGAAPTAGQPTW